MTGRTTTALRFSALAGAMACASCGSSDAGPAQTPSAPPASGTFADPPPSAVRSTLTLDAFDVEPGGEVYKCQNFRNPVSADAAILQSQSSMSHGSHHLAVFRITDNADGAIEDCSGLEFHTTLHAAQTPTARTEYPPGIGVFLPATSGIRLNAHYLNLTDQTVHAKVVVAFDTVGADEITNKASQIYMNDGTFDIAPGTGTAGGTLAIPVEVGDIELLSAQSHMHRHAVHFLATAEDGTTLYETNSWSEPPVKTFDPEVPLAAGSSITWRCDIDNQTSAHLTFGESADTNEMCVFSAFYYPAPDGKTVVGDVAIGRTFLTE
jgi:hypothetical protein